MKLSSVIICGHKKKFLSKTFTYEKRPVYEKKFIINGKYYRNFYQCKICKHMYASHKFDIKQLYSKQYLEFTYKDENGIHKRFNKITKLPILKSDNKNRAKRVNQFFSKKNLKLLDVGSGTGVFMYEMRKKSWKVSGIEMDKRYANYCKKFHKLQVYHQKLSKFKLFKTFNLISFNKVLEHVKNPIGLLNLSKKFLLKNGTIYIEVPYIKAKTEGKHRQEFCIDHLNVFSKSSLTLMTRKCGLISLGIKEIHEPSGKFTLYGFFKIGKVKD